MSSIRDGKSLLLLHTVLRLARFLHRLIVINGFDILEVLHLRGKAKAPIVVIGGTRRARRLRTLKLPRSFSIYSAPTQY